MTMLAPKALVQTRFIGRREVGLGLTATDETRQVDRFACGAARPTDFGEVALKRNAHDVRRALPGRPLQGFELPGQLLGQSRIESHQVPLSYALYDRLKAMSRKGGVWAGRGPHHAVAASSRTSTVETTSTVEKPWCLVTITCWANSSRSSGMWVMMPTIRPPTRSPWRVSETSARVSGSRVPKPSSMNRLSRFTAPTARCTWSLSSKARA